MPVLRKLSRQVEGTDKKAGLASDLIASAWELFSRNQEQVETLLKQYAGEVAQKRGAKVAADKAEANGGVSRFTAPTQAGGNTV